MTKEQEQVFNNKCVGGWRLADWRSKVWRSSSSKRWNEKGRSKDGRHNFCYLLSLSSRESTYLPIHTYSMYVSTVATQATVASFSCVMSRVSQSVSSSKLTTYSVPTSLSTKLATGT